MLSTPSTIRHTTQEHRDLFKNRTGLQPDIVSTTAMNSQKMMSTSQEERSRIVISQAGKFIPSPANPDPPTRRPKRTSSQKEGIDTSQA